MNRKELLVLSIGVFLTIIAWMMVDIYQVQNNIKITEDSSVQQVQNYKIDSQIFKSLETRSP